MFRQRCLQMVHQQSIRRLLHCPTPRQPLDRATGRSVLFRLDCCGQLHCLRPLIFCVQSNQWGYQPAPLGGQQLRFGSSALYLIEVQSVNHPKGIERPHSLNLHTSRTAATASLRPIQCAGQPLEMNQVGMVSSSWLDFRRLRPEPFASRLPGWLTS